MMRSAKKTYEIDMLHGAILPKLLRFAVPLTLSTMLQLLFNACLLYTSPSPRDTR